MELETPEHVTNRAFHEMEITPGTICRQHYQDKDTGEWEHGQWFVVLTRPKMDSKGFGERVSVVFLDGDQKGRKKWYYLRDLGVQPPYRAVCETHDLQIPEKYIVTTRIAWFVQAVLRKLTPSTPFL